MPLVTVPLPRSPYHCPGPGLGRGCGRAPRLAAPRAASGLRGQRARGGVQRGGQAGGWGGGAGENRCMARMGERTWGARGGGKQSTSSANEPVVGGRLYASEAGHLRNKGLIFPCANKSKGLGQWAVRHPWRPICRHISVLAWHALGHPRWWPWWRRGRRGGGRSRTGSPPDLARNKPCAVHTWRRPPCCVHLIPCCVSVLMCQVRCTPNSKALVRPEASSPDTTDTPLTRPQAIKATLQSLQPAPSDVVFQEVGGAPHRGRGRLKREGSGSGTMCP